MGIFKSFDFFPEVGHLIGTVTAYFLDIGYLVDQLTVGEDRLQDAAGREIGEILLLPGVFWIKQLDWFALVDGFIVQAHHVGKCLTALIVIEAIHFFEVGSGNFCGIFTDFNFRNDGAILILRALRER